MAYAGLLFVVGYSLVMAFPSIPIHFFAWFFLAAGEVLLLTKEGVYLANNSPSSHRGRIQGVLVTLRSVFVIPSFVGIGYIIDKYGFKITWISVIVCALIASIGLYLMSRHKKHYETVRV